MFEMPKPAWEEEDASAEPCSACKELIFTKGHRMHVDGEPTEIVVCAPCYAEAMRG